MTGYPTILFVDQDGALVDRIDGYVEAPSFANTMAKTIENGPRVKSYLSEFSEGMYRNSQGLVSMLIEMGRVDEAAPVFDRLRSVATLPPQLQEHAALAIASNLLDNAQYERCLQYIRIVEDTDPASDASWDARRLRAIVVFYTKGKTPALEYVEQLILNNQAPSAWRDRYKHLDDQMKAAKDQGSP